MAKALRCPACGFPHPLAEFQDVAVFVCRNCNQALKVPGAAQPGGVPESLQERPERVLWSAKDEQRAAEPSPEMEQEPEADTGSVVSIPEPVAASAPAPSAPVGTAVLPKTEIREPKKEQQVSQPSVATQDLGRAWHVFFWIVGMSLSLVVVAVVGRVAGLVSKTDVARIVLDDNLNRLIPVALFIVAWGLVAALCTELVTQFAQRLLARRSQ